MKLLALAALLVLLSPSAAAFGLQTGAPLLAADQDAPQGCVVEGGGWTCQWAVNFNDMAAKVNQSIDHAIPVFSTTLATITISHDGTNQGWRFAVMETTSNGTIEVTKSERLAAPSKELHQSESTTHVFLQRPGARYTLRFWDEYYESASLSSYEQGPSAFGSFAITYQAQPVPVGSAPSRPAATRDDPHVQGVAHAAPADLDIMAAWMDDPALGDGLFDAYVAVENLSAITFPSPGGVSDPAGASSAQYMRWTYNFTVTGLDYAVQWEILRDNSAAGYANDGCELLRGSERQVVARPLCSMNLTTGVLSATIPERIVGPPGDGILFTDMHVVSTTLVQRDPPAGEIVWHQLDVMHYPFALGGPRVWSVLNHRLDPKLDIVPPFYLDPLAPDNLPNTLQVAGAGVAIIGFLGGLILVRRRHHHTKALLDRVEDIARAPRFDTPQTLLALGELESEFTVLFRRGKITEGQYQILSQRIASVATRFALRRELGLDDGVPGAETPSRTIPIMSTDSSARANPLASKE